MYSIKRGVTIFMSPEIEKMLEVVCLVYATFRVPVVITSGVDGPHKEGSKHFNFHAFDIRKNFHSLFDDTTWRIHRDMILSALEDQFSIRKLHVAIVNELDHIHIEWIGA